MDGFSLPTRAWFDASFPSPTAAQEGAWRAIRQHRHVLVSAPTGSGKTLAAFLWSIDRVFSSPPPDPRRRLRILYVSPLKALAFDVERNLQRPLQGIQDAAARRGQTLPPVVVGVRTGDTPADARRRLGTHPPDILITTPESLYLLLTSRSRQILTSIDTVIVDEVHAVAGTKRGAHLALSLERLDVLLPAPARRIGLSATARPLEEVARFLGGIQPVDVVNPPTRKAWHLSVELPEPVAPEESFWPSIESRLVDLIRTHRSTIVFANSRRLAERLCARLNEVAGETLARAHHGSVSREERVDIEGALKEGRLPAVVATSSLELGIDMGAVDLVVQVEAPPSVASGLQRIGRAGHGVGDVSRGIIVPKWRGDLLLAAVVSERMQAGAIESIRILRHPLDVLAQQVVAMVSMDDWSVEGIGIVIRRAASFSTLPQGALDGVLDMLSGHYPTDAFAELKPHLVWDREAGMLSGRRHAHSLAVVNGGTIPDRGLFGVFLAGDKPHRVGELDEEMVYESKVGDVFALGSSSWRIEEIGADRVLVTPAPGEPARMPFWKGDAPGRPVELGQAFGAFLDDLSAAPQDAGRQRLARAGLDQATATTLLDYLHEQQDVTGHLPTARTIVVERFKDEVGDWRVCIHSPFGSPVHTPWALAIAARVRHRLGIEVQAMPGDDGIVLRLPQSDTALPSDSILFEPDEIEATVISAVGTSALFASRFRECAARALLLPRRRPGQRTPLWQQRQRSATLLQAASTYPSFPMVLETMRECLQDVFDVPALRTLMADLRSRRIRLVQVDTVRASPFARSLLLRYLGSFIYDGDAPLAERRAQGLMLDSGLLAELLGQSELRELLDPDVVAQVERELLGLTSPLRHVEDLSDALRRFGDMAVDDVVARCGSPDDLADLYRTRRAFPLAWKDGSTRWVSAEDVVRYRDALGLAVPPGVPVALLAPVADALGDLVSRHARTHGPFHAADLAAWYGVDVGPALHRLQAAGRVLQGEFRPGGHGLEWCDADVLRRLRRRSLARLRHEVEAVPVATLARFAPVWHHVGSARSHGPDALLRAVEQLQGTPLPASALERLILPARVRDYTPAMLDQVCAAGEVLWVGRGSLGRQDGWVSLYLAQDAEHLLPAAADPPSSPLHAALLEALQGALFFRQIGAAAGPAVGDGELLQALWELVWAGLVTNDTLAPLRAVLQGATLSERPVRRRSWRTAAMPSRLGPPAGAGRWTRVPAARSDTTRRRTVLAEQLLDRHGILTRPAVMAEDVEGGFAALYPVLKAFEEAGHCRRGYFVEGLGGAQFAMKGAVDRLRDVPPDPFGRVLASTDPASVWGAAVAWPSPGGAGRKPGALVIQVDGVLVLYLERGGRTLLSFDDDPIRQRLALEALIAWVREVRLPYLTIERVNGTLVFDSPLAGLLQHEGFRDTPKGLVLRM